MQNTAATSQVFKKIHLHTEFNKNDLNVGFFFPIGRQFTDPSYHVYVEGSPVVLLPVKYLFHRAYSKESGHRMLVIVFLISLTILGKHPKIDRHFMVFS